MSSNLGHPGHSLLTPSYWGVAWSAMLISHPAPCHGWGWLVSCLSLEHIWLLLSKRQMPRLATWRLFFLTGIGFLTLSYREARYWVCLAKPVIHPNTLSLYSWATSQVQSVSWKRTPSSGEFSGTSCTWCHTNSQPPKFHLAQWTNTEYVIMNAAAKHTYGTSLIQVKFVIQNWTVLPRDFSLIPGII